LVTYMAYTINIGLHGTKLDDGSLQNHIVNAFSVGYHNLIEMKDFIRFDYISIFMYSGVLVLLILIIYSSRMGITGKHIQRKNLLIFAIFALISLFFQLFFHYGGLRSPFLYNNNYFLCNIILTYAGICWVMEKTKIKTKKITYLASAIFFIAALFISPHLSVHYRPDPPRNEFLEILHLRDDVIPDSSCQILKFTIEQPRFDFYTGTQEKAIYLGGGTALYEEIRNLDKEGKCYYFYDEEYLSENDYQERAALERVDHDMLDESFSCQKSVELKSTFPSWPYTLYKYQC